MAVCSQRCSFLSTGAEEVQYLARHRAQCQYPIQILGHLLGAILQAKVVLKKKKKSISKISNSAASQTTYFYAAFISQNLIYTVFISSGLNRLFIGSFLWYKNYRSYLAVRCVRSYVYDLIRYILYILSILYWKKLSETNHDVY